MKRALQASAPIARAPAERERNRLLRRADWRFLLPDPNPAKTACFAGGILLESLRLISQSVVDGRNGSEAHGCDLAVAIDPSRETLALAYSSLKPGGFLYSEWRGLPGRVKSRVRARLEAAGFEQPRFYWPHPDPSSANPAAWIPLQSRGAVHYYFVANRGRSRTPLRRAVRDAARRASAAAPRLQLARPVCALAGKPPAAAPGRYTLEPLLASRWSDWGLGARPRSLSWLLLTGGLRSESKIIALVFADASKLPVVAAKMPRLAESGQAIAREADVLRALEERFGGDLPAGIPRVLFFENKGKVPVLGETAFTGVPLLSAWTRDNYEDLALRASGWLAGLAGRRSPSPPEEWWRRLVGPVLSRFAETFGRVAETSLLEESEAVLKTLPPLPLVCEQRDFSPWNILLTPGGELAVVDWESAELDGLPALDLIYFLASLGFSFDSARRTGRYRESYRRLHDQDTPNGSLAARCLSSYQSRVGFDPAALRPLRLLTWMVHAASEFRHLQAEFGQAPGVEVLREAVCVQLWEEELAAGRRKREDRV